MGLQGTKKVKGTRWEKGGKKVGKTALDSRERAKNAF